ncbi:hypothetical protein [Streptomyces sp. CBMA152]|uniref:hypothetical protein n=1 Tax=Streptomyces sp. CBMA152 TaxID=1896312 RepID=UPI00166167A0|nr:hypothetical protein [Streptomyces sp. CBMA152]MBD0747113.1 hypothetical protein [Streptomyces sp. CBMA152]
MRGEEYGAVDAGPGPFPVDPASGSGSAPVGPVEASASAQGESPVPPPRPELSPVALLPTEERDKWALRLHRAVSGFVDEPRQAVSEADAVLGEVVARLPDLVRERRAVASGKADTEELRLALRECRALTERLLEL